MTGTFIEVPTSWDVQKCSCAVNTAISTEIKENRFGLDDRCIRLFEWPGIHHVHINVRIEMPTTMVYKFSLQPRQYVQIVSHHAHIV